jgi:Ni/Co efflux regulator RcnB
MKTKTMRPRIFFPARGRSLLALAAASAVCGLALVSATPARAEGNDKHEEKKDKVEHRDQRHGDREHRRHEEPRYYPQPIYAPPAVYYPPQQSPGVSLFLPLNIHIR